MMIEKNVVILSDLKLRVNMLKQLNIPHEFDIIGIVSQNKIDIKKISLYRLEYSNKVYLEQFHRTKGDTNNTILVYDFEKGKEPKEWFLEVDDEHIGFSLDYLSNRIDL